MAKKTKERELDKELREIKARKRNIKIYPLYKSLSWDLLFYYAIIYAFLLEQKTITSSQIMTFQACYIIFRFLLQMPCTLLIGKIGKSGAIVFGNLVSLLSTATIIIAPNFPVLIFSQFLSAIAFNLKEICESDILYDSLQPTEERSKSFTKIDGKAFSSFFYISAASALIAGFLYKVNPVLPLVVSCIFSAISLIISMGFEDIHYNREEAKKGKISYQIKEMRVTTKLIFKSHRLRYLLLLDGIFYAIFYSIAMLRSNELLYVGVDVQYIGIIYALCVVASAISSNHAQRIHEKRRNRTLESLVIPAALIFLISGLLMFMKDNAIFVIPTIIILYIVQTSVQGPYIVLMKKYLNNFTNNKKRVRISSAKITMDSFISGVLLFVQAFMMAHMEDKYSVLIMGAFFSVITIFLFIRMRKYVGLPMEEYKKGEIL